MTDDDELFEKIPGGVRIRLNGLQAQIVAAYIRQAARKLDLQIAQDGNAISLNDEHVALRLFEETLRLMEKASGDAKAREPAD